MIHLMSCSRMSFIYSERMILFNTKCTRKNWSRENPFGGDVSVSECAKVYCNCGGMMSSVCGGNRLMDLRACPYTSSFSVWGRISTSFIKYVNFTNNYILCQKYLQTTQKKY